MSASARRRRPFLNGERPIAFAHRGGSALAPENTLQAFRQALALGIRFIETDLHMTRDGVIVVSHDERLERCTDGHGRIAEHRLAELRSFDAGYRFSPDGRSFPARGKGDCIPTLEEVVELSPELHLNVEVKQRWPSMLRPLWDFIRTRGLEERFLVAAAQDPLVREFRGVSGGRVATSAGRSEVLAFWAAARAGLDRVLPVGYDALQVPVKAGILTVIEEGLLRAAHRRGLHVHAWTIDEQVEMDRLLDLGVDGIMSDRPDRLMRAISQRRAAT